MGQEKDPARSLRVLLGTEAAVFHDGTVFHGLYWGTGQLWILSLRALSLA